MKKRLYHPRQEREDIELLTGKATYLTVIDNFLVHYIPCNKIIELDLDLFDNIVIGKIDKPTKDYDAFICCFTLEEEGMEELKELEKDNHDNSIIIAYSKLLECYVWLLPKSVEYWDETLTNIELKD